MLLGLGYNMIMYIIIVFTFYLLYWIFKFIKVSIIKIKLTFIKLFELSILKLKYIKQNFDEISKFCLMCGVIYLIIHLYIVEKLNYIYTFNFIVIIGYCYIKKITVLIKKKIYYRYYLAILSIFNFNYLMKEKSLKNMMLFIIIFLSYIFLLKKIENIIDQMEKNKNTNKNIKPKKLFSAKQNKVDELIEIINDDDIPSIVINQKIGSGKTLFIENTIYKLNKDNNNNNKDDDMIEIIYIKLPYIKNLEELKKTLIQEFKTIFKKNNLEIDYLGFILNYISTIKTSKIEVILKKENETFWNSLKLLKENLLKLDKEKQILVIVDDIERCESSSFIKKSIYFLGEFAEFFRGTKATILFLVDIKNIVNNSNEKNDLFDKYFSYELIIPEINMLNFTESDFVTLYKINQNINNYTYEDIKILFDIWNEFHCENILKKLNDSKELESENKIKLEKFQQFAIKKNNIRNIKRFFSEVSRLEKLKTLPKPDRIILLIPYFFKNFYSIYIEEFDNLKISLLESLDFKNISKEFIYFYYIKGIYKIYLFYKSQNEQGLNYKANNLIKFRKNLIKNYELTYYDKVIQYIILDRNDLTSFELNWEKYMIILENMEKKSEYLYKLLDFKLNFNLDEIYFTFILEYLKDDLNEKTLLKLVKFLLEKYKLKQHNYIELNEPVTLEDDNYNNSSIYEQKKIFKEIYIKITKITKKLNLNNPLVNEYTKILKGIVNGEIINYINIDNYPDFDYPDDYDHFDNHDDFEIEPIK